MIKNVIIVILSISLFWLILVLNQGNDINKDLVSTNTNDSIGGVADDTMTELNRIISDLNTSYWRLNNYYEDWATLPAGVKTAIKNRTIQKIDTTITDLQAVRTQISNF